MTTVTQPKRCTHSPYLGKLPTYRYTVRDAAGRRVSYHRSLAAARHWKNAIPEGIWTIYDEWDDAPAT